VPHDIQLCYNTSMTEPRLVLFDGNGIIHRAFHAFEKSRTLTSKSGEIVSAVYGFASMLLKAVTDLQPTHWAIAFDKAAPTFRHQMFDEYKANRPKTPDELINQFGRVRQLVEAFHIPIFELDGFEADDIIGTLCSQASQQGMDSVIVTGDADTMQLISSKIKVLYPRPKGTFSDTILYDDAQVVERYGVKPGNIADLKALVGDTSDNIPGVRGIGDKTAVKLIQQFGSIEDIYNHLNEVTPPRLQTLLRDNEETARKCKILATIVTNAPVNLNLEQCQVTHYHRDMVTALFRELGFASLLGKLGQFEQETAQPALMPQPEIVPAKYHLVNTVSALEALMTQLKKAGTFSFDLESTSLDPMSAEIVGFSFAIAPGEAFYIPVGHVGLLTEPQLPLSVVLKHLNPVFEDVIPAKAAHNANYDTTILAENGIEVNNLTFDSMIAAHLLSEKSLGLKALAFERLGVEMTPITLLIGTGTKQIPMSQVDILRTVDYAAADADMTLRLAGIFEPELKKDELWPLFADVEMPLVPVLVNMQRNGVLLDTARLKEMSLHLGNQIGKLEQEIYNYAGHQFNINSPQQLGEILFQELKLPARKKGSSYSTGADVLEELRNEHKIISPILEYRQLSKLKSTYVDALPGLINPKTGRVHTSFNQTKTATGRLSSSDPNLQNIPIRTELGREIRLAFVAPEGSFLISSDYSQIDLRALAHLSQDEGLLEAFRHDEDIHAATASRLYGVMPLFVTPDMRRVAKTVNFGVIYGMSEYGLEQATELSREEAAKFISSYFEKYPRVTRYLEATRQQAREKGYVQTLLGRKRAIPEVNSPNRQVRQAAERMAINMPVQGTSADIIKVAMVNLYREMKQRGLKSKMLLQVHDELVFEVPEGELKEMQDLVPHLMSTAIKLSIPVKVDTKVGRNWGEMK
jgi:DNA polymerase I